MKMTVEVDKEKCIGCQACTVICPGIFVMDGMKSVVKKQDDKCGKKAAESCPVDAIIVK
jgi:ferredoxin